MGYFNALTLAVLLSCAACSNSQSIGVFNSYNITSLLNLFSTSAQQSIRTNFISLGVAEPNNFNAAHSVFSLLKSQANMVAFIGLFSPVLGSIARELNMQYFIIDIDNTGMNIELLKIRQFIAKTSLNYVDQPGKWFFSSESATLFNNNTKVVSSKMAYLVPAKIMMYEGSNPSYTQLNVTSSVAIFTVDMLGAATFFSTPLYFPYAAKASYIVDTKIVRASIFSANSSGKDEVLIYDTLRKLRDKNYSMFVLDTNDVDHLSTAATKIPLELGMLTQSKLWVFQRWNGEPAFTASIPDAPGWTTASTDAAYLKQAGNQNQNMLYQVMLFLLKTALNVSSVTVLNNFNFNLYGPSISRFQDLYELSIAVADKSTGVTTLWQTGADILGRTTYISFEQTNQTAQNASTMIDYQSLAGLNLTVPLVVDPPFVLINATSGKPYGMAVEIINQLAWYIGFTVNFYYLTNYGSSSGTVRFLNQSTNASFLRQTRSPAMAFAVGGLYYTAVDAQQVNFLKPYITPMGVNLLMRNNTADTTWQFAQPLSTGVYILIAAVLILLPTAFSCLDVIVRNDPNKRLFSPAGSFWYVYGQLTMATVDILPTRFSTKILSLFMVSAFLILLNSYQSGLIALYFFARVDNNIRNISSLVSVNKNGVNYPVILLSGSVPGRYINGFSQPSLSRTLQRLPAPALPMMAHIMSQLYQMNSTMNLLTAVSNYTYLLPALQANNNVTKTIVLGSNILNQWLQNQDCGLRIVGDTIDIRFLSLATPIGAKYATELSAALSALQANNTISNIINYYVVGTCPAAVGSYPLRIADLAGIFYILAAGGAISILIAVSQKAYYANQIKKWKKKVKPLQFGEIYIATVTEICSDGAKIELPGQPKTFFVPNRNFAPQAVLPTSVDMHDIIAGDKIEVKYFGKDAGTRKRLFVYKKKVPDSRPFDS